MRNFHTVLLPVPGVDSDLAHLLLGGSKELLLHLLELLFMSVFIVISSFSLSQFPARVHCHDKVRVFRSWLGRDHKLSLQLVKVLHILLGHEGRLVH